MINYKVDEKIKGLRKVMKTHLIVGFVTFLISASLLYFASLGWHVKWWFYILPAVPNVITAIIYQYIIDEKQDEKDVTMG